MQRALLLDYSHLSILVDPSRMVLVGFILGMVINEQVKAVARQELHRMSTAQLQLSCKEIVVLTIAAGYNNEQQIMKLLVNPLPERKRPHNMLLT